MQSRENQSISSCPRHNAEQGYLLLGLLFLVAILMIGLAIAAPKIAKEIQREKEIETVHRGEQYKRAIQLYYRKFGSYPMSIDQLKETNQIRFLRQEYIDPMTGKKDWKLLHLGQVQMQAMGLFGQPLGGAGGAPVPGVPGSGLPGAGGAPGNLGAAQGIASGIGGGNSLGGGSSLGGNSGLGSSSGLGGSSSGSDNFFNDASASNSSDAAGAASNATPSPGTNTLTAPDQQSTEAGGADDLGSTSDSGFGSSNGSPFGASGGQTTISSTGGGASPGGFGSQTAGAVLGGANGISGTPGAPGSPGTAGMFGGSGGGAPIVGVTVPLKKKSMLSYRKKTIYDQWQFVYNPQEDINNSAGIDGGTPGAGIGTPAGSSPGSGFGQNPTSGASPFNSAGGGLSSSSSSSFGGSSVGSSGAGATTGSSTAEQSSPQ